MSKRKNNDLWQIGGVFGLLGVSILVNQIIKGRHKDDSLEVNITPTSQNLKKPSPPSLKLSTLKNFRSDGITLCPGVSEVLDSSKKRVQYFTPIEKPDNYILLPKVFEKTSANSTIPDFKETIKPLENSEGLIAYTPEQRLKNIRTIAYAIGKLKTEADKTNNTIKADNYENFIGSYSLLDFLTKVLSVEANNINTSPNSNIYDLQREQVAILWCLINRLTTGSTKLTTRSEGNAISSIKTKAIGYDPDLILNADAKKMERKACLLPLVKAFLYGFFNDETNGATHWMHVNANLKRLPPLYHYAFDTKQKSDPTKGFEPYQLRSVNEENHYINDCVVVKVDEIEAVKAYNEWKNTKLDDVTKNQ